MNVLILSHMYPSAANEVYGIFVHEQARALRDLGVGVRVVNPVRGAPPLLRFLNPRLANLTEVPPRSRLDGIEVHHPRYSLLPKAMLYHTSVDFMSRAVEEVLTEIHEDSPFDLIHAHVALPDGAVALRVGRRMGIPIVVTVHGADVYQHLGRSRRCRSIIEHVFAEADRTIFVSRGLQRTAERKLGRSIRADIVGNGVSAGTVREGDEQASPRTGPATIFSASYLVPRKAIRFNLLALAELSDKHPDVRYRIAGDGPEAAGLRHLAQDLGLAHRVEFLGMLTHEETLEAMGQADIFSLPSWDEAFGVVYIEAMAAGCPVIACRGEGIEDVITHGDTGWLVEPRDVASLAAAFDTLLSRSDEARSMGERGRIEVLGRHTWQGVGQRLRDVYEDVLQRSS